MKKQDSLSEIILDSGKTDGNLVISLSNLLSNSSGFGILLIIISLPSALPVPAPGYSTPFGILLSYLGIQILLNKQEPRLPKKLKNLEIEISEKNGLRVKKYLNLLEKFTRSRLSLLNGILIKRIAGLNIIILALIMIVPIPLTNTAPACMIFLFGVAIFKQDGFLLLLAQIVTQIIFVAYFLLFFMVYRYGLEKGIACFKSFFNT